MPFFPSLFFFYGIDIDDDKFFISFSFFISFFFFFFFFLISFLLFSLQICIFRFRPDPSKSEPNMGPVTSLEWLGNLSGSYFLRFVLQYGSPSDEGANHTARNPPANSHARSTIRNAGTAQRLPRTAASTTPGRVRHPHVSLTGRVTAAFLCFVFCFLFFPSPVCPPVTAIGSGPFVGLPRSSFLPAWRSMQIDAAHCWRPPEIDGDQMAWPRHDTMRWHYIG